MIGHARRRWPLSLATAALMAGMVLAASPAAAGSPVVHRVSAGGADLCEAIGQPTGCDRNYSLVAVVRADDSVGGQWQDTFGGPIGGLGLHIAVDCVHLVGNGAVIGGVITHGLVLDPITSEPMDPSGERAVTAVVDSGQSTNDAPDQIGPTLPEVVFGGLVCTDLEPGDLPLLPLTNGQVVVH